MKQSAPFSLQIAPILLVVASLGSGKTVEQIKTDIKYILLLP